MDLKEALSYIEGTLKFGSILGLDNIKELLRRLGHPEKDLKVVHVAGTNGKGSTCAFLNHILMAEGYKVGFYSSPSLECFNERIRVNFENISDHDLVSLTERVKETIDQMVADGLTHPTEFEIVTAMALLHFKNVACDYVILEVGLGGRYDSTNVCDQPLLTIITPIAMDHIHILGDTLSKIAYEKAGIIKRNRPLILHPQDEEARDTVIAIAKELEAPYTIPNTSLFHVDKYALNEIVFDYQSDKYTITMTGTYQIHNAIMAIEASSVLKTLGVEISDESVKKGLMETQWPARFELFSKDPYVFIDGAHNLQGAESLVDTLNVHTKGMKRIACFGAFGDKDVEGVLRLTEKYFDTFVLVSAPHERSLSVKDIRDMLMEINPDKNVILSESLEDGIDKTDHLEADFKLYFGSLHMVGQIRKLLKNRK